MRGNRILAVAIAVAVLIGLMVAGDSPAGMATGEPQATAAVEDLEARQTLTNWQFFGNGGAWVRDSFDCGVVNLQSTTLQDPQEVRFLVRGRPFTTVDIDFGINCIDHGTGDFYFGDSVRVTTPYVHKIVTVGYEYCTLWVGARRQDAGKLVVKFQSKYLDF